MKKFKEMLQSINKLGLALVLVATTLVITQSAFTSSKRAGTHRYDPSLTQQDWNSTIDQDPAHYILIGATPTDCQNTDQICTYDYDAVNEKFMQNTKGTFQ